MSKSSSFKLKELPPQDRPREKLMERGPGALSDAELLALFFGTGTQGTNVVEMSQQLLQRFGGLNALGRCSVADLKIQPGIGPAKATNLVAASELGRRMAREAAHDQAMDNPAAVCALLGPEMRLLRRESVRVLVLNTKFRLICVEEISSGTVNEVMAHPRDVLRPCLVHSAPAFIFTHNHPSGDTQPSAADRTLTRKLVEAAHFMQINMLDHIIIGQPTPASPEGYFSFREHGLL